MKAFPIPAREKVEFVCAIEILGSSFQTILPSDGRRHEATFNDGVYHSACGSGVFSLN